MQDKVIQKLDHDLLLNGMKIKKGDNVIIIAGNDKGKRGKVLKAMPLLNKVIVEGVNIHKKAHRSRKSSDSSQIIDVAMPVHVSNVAKQE